MGPSSYDGWGPVAVARSLAEKGWVPAWRWALWWFLLVPADIVFYVVLTPVWLGIRATAWLAEFRARRKRT